MSFLKNLFGRKDEPQTPRRPEFLAIDKALKPHARSCWTPETVSREGTMLSSKFGGAPALRASEPHPTCAACKSVMPLWLQLNLASLPDRAKTVLPSNLREGLLQFFYCTANECDNSDFTAFSGNMLARVLPSASLATFNTNPNTAHPAALITGWREHQDYPGFEEAESILGSGFDRKILLSYLDEFDGKGAEPLGKDKLLGWPYWIQGVEYPECSICKQRMIYVFQIESEDHIPFMFGDSGNGHMSVCPKHPERAAFSWSCC